MKKCQCGNQIKNRYAKQCRECYYLVLKSSNNHLIKYNIKYGSYWKGKKLTEEHKKRMGIGNKGKKAPYNIEKNKTLKMRMASSLSKMGDKNPMKRKEVRDKVSKWRTGRPNFSIRGEKHYNWKGGINPINDTIRHSIKYRLWRKSVFERDNYTCIFCGVRSGNGKTIVLNADHIKPFILYPKLRFVLDNGRTLCIDCHKTTNTYGIKIRKYYYDSI